MSSTRRNSGTCRSRRACRPPRYRRGVGVAADVVSQAYPGQTTFDGINLTASQILVKYTYVGDTNFDGVVDAGDLANLLAGMHGGLTGWINGDTNYDGVINQTDLNNLMAVLAGQGAPFTDAGTAVLVSEAVVMRVRDRFEFRALDAVVAKGMTKETRIFELVGASA